MHPNYIKYPNYYGIGFYSDGTINNNFVSDNHQTDKDSEIDKLSKQFDQLKDTMKEDGYITVGSFCKTMNLDCDNKYDFYCGNKDKWQKAMINALLFWSDDPEESKLLIEALHNQYDEEEE